MLPINSKVCIISARRFGDAIINASIAKKVALCRPDIEWIIWTKPEFTPLFKLMGFNHIITSDFPIAGGLPKFAKNCGVSLVRAIAHLRKLKIDASIDFIGDTREAMFGALITGKAHQSPQWEASHWMHRLIWNFKVPLVQYSTISTEQDRMYNVIAALLAKLTGVILKTNGQIDSVKHRPIIAYHPFSSQEFKSWPKQSWQKLTSLLNEKEFTPIVLCTNEEGEKAKQLFTNNTMQTISATNSLEELISKVNSIDILVGIDSFLVHLAAALGKRTVVINSGNLPRWWQPPNAEVLGQSGGCSRYPCSNEPSCLGTTHQSKCIRSIEPQQVLKAIDEALV